MLPTDEERALVAETRHDPLETAQQLRRLAEKYQLSQAALAKQVGRRRSTVTNFLRLLSLPLSIQDSLRREEISIGHAKLLLSVVAREQQLELHARIVREKLTVRQAADCARAIPRQERESRADALHRRTLADQLQERLGTKVEIESAQVIIDYYGLEDLQGLLDKLGLTEGA